MSKRAKKSSRWSSVPRLDLSKLVLGPAWTDFYTKAEFEKEFGTAYVGDGMYLTNKDTLFAVRMHGVSKREAEGKGLREKHPKKKIRVDVWNAPVHETILSITIPTRVDLRD